MWYEQLCKHTEWLVVDCLLHIFESCWNPVSLSWGFSLLDSAAIFWRTYILLVRRLRCLLVRSGLNWGWFILAILQLCIIVGGLSLHICMLGCREETGTGHHWTIDYRLIFPFSTPLQTSHLNLSLAIRFHFSPVNKKSKSSREKWVARWWKPLSQAKPRSEWS